MQPEQPEQHNNGNGNGKPKPGQLSPVEQQRREQIIARTKTMIAQCMHTGEIKKALFREFDIAWRQAMKYIGIARKEILESEGVSLEDKRSRSRAFYESVLQDPAATMFDKLRANERLDKLDGLEAPQRREVSGPAGAAPQDVKVVVISDPNFYGRHVQDQSPSALAAPDSDPDQWSTI